MASESKTTTDHKEIQQWAEARGGKPSTVKRTGTNGEPGVLRINFPGYSGEDTLEEITWDEFFTKFDQNNLAFLYQEHTSSGEESRFFKLVSRDTAEHKTSSKSHSKEDDHSTKTSSSHSHKDEAGHTEHKTSGSSHSHKDETAHSEHKSTSHKEHDTAKSASSHEHKKDEPAKVEHKTSDKSHSHKDDHPAKGEHKSSAKLHTKEDDHSSKSEHKSSTKSHK